MTNSSFIATGDFLQVTDPAGSFPQFESWPAAEYLSGLSGPFDPHSGQSFMWSDRADEAYKRLTRTIDVPAGGTTLSFWTSYNLELAFDYMIVEAHTVGQDNWTTLPDENGHTSSDLTDDQSCTGGWSNPDDAANVLHPFLQHYQEFLDDGTCANTGTTGEWNAANGSSSGWQQFQINIPEELGPQVEISITALSDWGFQQFPGVFIDDIDVGGAGTTEGDTSFEEDDDPMDGWTVPGAPQDDAGIEGPNRNDWVRRGGLGIKEGAAVATDDTVYLGFGLEGITGAANRNDVMGRVDRLPAALTSARRAAPRACRPSGLRAYSESSISSASGPVPGGTRSEMSPRPHSSSGQSDVSTASTPRSASDCRKARPVARSPKSPTMSQSS